MLAPAGSPLCSERPIRVPSRHGAFSLVEVVLALGITASALLVIFSLMPLGLSSLQDTQRQIVETEIYNKIGSELGTTALYRDPSLDPTRTSNLLNDYCRSNRFPAYFDVEGNELAASPTTAAHTVFTVRCAQGVPPNTSTWAPSGPTGELFYGTVMIGFHQDPQTATATATSVHRRTFLLSNHGS